MVGQKSLPDANITMVPHLPRQYWDNGPNHCVYSFSGPPDCMIKGDTNASPMPDSNGPPFDISDAGNNDHLGLAKLKSCVTHFLKGQPRR